MRIRILVSCFVLVLLGISYGCFGNVIRTENEQQQQYYQLFSKHCNKIDRRENKVWIQSDGFFRIKTAFGETSPEFYLTQNESFYGPPDHHTLAKFTLKEIGEDGIVIEYETKFDHRSFGKNLVVTDKGILELKWK